MEIIIAVLALIVSVILGLPQLIISYLQFKMSKSESKTNKKLPLVDKQKLKEPSDKAFRISNNVSYECTKARRQDLQIINKIANKAFGLERVSNTTLMEEWYMQDPAIYHVITREKTNSVDGSIHKKIVGYFSVMRITESAVTKLIPKIAPIENVIASDIDRNSSIVYIAAIVGTTNYIKGIVMSNIILYLREKIEDNKVTVLYARPVSDDGKRLLIKYDFVKYLSIDDCNLYKKDTF